MRKRVEAAQKRMEERQRLKEKQSTAATKPAAAAVGPGAAAAAPRPVTPAPPRPATRPAARVAPNLPKAVYALVEKANAAVAKPLPPNATTAQKEFAVTHRKQLVQTASDALMGAFVAAELTVLDVIRARDAGFRQPALGLAAKAEFDLPLPPPPGIEKGQWKPRLVIYFRGHDAALLEWAKGDRRGVEGTVEAVRFDGLGTEEDWKAVSTVTVWLAAGGRGDPELDPAAAGSPAGPMTTSQRGKIVFLCDATGTMINKFALLRAELTKAIDNLKPGQSFNIVFFFDGPKAASINNLESLLLATPENKRKAYKFMEDFSTTGQTDPLPGIRLAFKMQPQLIYFLSDGEFNNLVPYVQVVAEIDKLNKDRKTRVNTIQFGTYDKQAEGVLRLIASEHGGAFRFISGDVLAANADGAPAHNAARRGAPDGRPSVSGRSIFDE
jgi:hypothetical protein